MNGINSNTSADVVGIKSDRVRVTISDCTGEAKWSVMTPKAAHDLAIEIMEAAYEAQGLKEFRVVVGVAYEAT